MLVMVGLMFSFRMARCRPLIYENRDESKQTAGFLQGRKTLFSAANNSIPALDYSTDVVEYKMISLAQRYGGRASRYGDPAFRYELVEGDSGAHTTVESCARDSNGDKKQRCYLSGFIVQNAVVLELIRKKEYEKADHLVIEFVDMEFER